MTSFRMHSERLPGTGKPVRFARRKGKRGYICGGKPPHFKYIKWTYGDAILFAIATVTIDDRQ